MYKNNSFKNANFPILWPFLIGLFGFLLAVGPRVLDPTNIAWLEQGDPSFHYLAWVFYRASEWSFPIGLNPNYGIELSNSIVYSDSIPLFAIFFKIFSDFLPDVFQYFGIWLLTCFLLQSWFSWKLVGLVTDSNLKKALATILFVFSPIMLFRLHGHFALVAHFLIIAALYLVLANKIKSKMIAWGALLSVSLLVHGYLFAMVGLIWLTDLIVRASKSKYTVKKCVYEFLILVIVVAFVGWVAGYFSVGRSISELGYGVYSANMLAVFDSSGWSYILKDLPYEENNLEGFNYLGLGVFFIILFLFPILIDKNNLIYLLNNNKLLVVSLLCFFVFSVSNVVTFGGSFFEYPLPDFVLKYANIFRASGRMFWPVYYMIIFVLLYMLIRGYKQTTSSILLAVAVLIQLTDTHSGWVGIRDKLMADRESNWATPLISSFWHEAEVHYQKIRWINPVNQSDLWHEKTRHIAYYAAEYNKSTDTVRLARINSNKLLQLQSRASLSLETGRYDDDSLYLIDDQSKSLAALNLNEEIDVLAEVDGFTVLAPNWRKCTECQLLENEVKLSELLTPITLGERIEFNQSSTYLLSGWSHTELWGTWSNGTESTLLLPLGKKDVISITIEAIPFVNSIITKQSLNISVNGLHVDNILLTQNEPSLFEVKIPKEALELGRIKGFLKIDLKLPNAISPKELGEGEDVRLLALGLIALTMY